MLVATRLPGAAADVRRLADLRRPRRRRADLPARRAGRQVGPRRAHQADRSDRRGRRDGAARRPAGVPVPARSPTSGRISLGPQLGVPLTILLTVLTVNALNFIDGLDGLAAGVSAIAALAFFAYSYNLGVVGYDDVASAPALITAVLAGACLGFLPHNFSPARIFMGDSGSMLVGLMLSAAAVTATGGVDAQSFDSAATPAAADAAAAGADRDPVHPVRRPGDGRGPAHPPRSVAVLAGQDAPAPPAALDRPLAPPRGAGHVLLGGAAVLRRGRRCRSPAGTAELLVAIARPAGGGRRRRPQPAGPPGGPGGAGGRAGRAARAQPGRAPDRAGAAGAASRAGPARRARAPRHGPPTPGRCCDDAPAGARRAAQAPWDISFLRVGALVTAAVTVVAAPVGGPASAAGPAPLGVLVGAAVVTAFFCVSGLVIAWAGRIDDAFTLPAALGHVPGQGAGLLRRPERAPGRRVGRPAGHGVDRRSPARCSGAASRRAGCGPGSCTTSPPPSPPLRRPPQVRCDPEKPASRG